MNIKIHKFMFGFVYLTIFTFLGHRAEAVVKILNNQQVNYMDMCVVKETGEVKYNNKDLENNIFMNKITNDKDVISGKSFKNSLVKFLINDIEYMTNTDEHGNFILLLEEGLLVDVDQINVKVYDGSSNELSNASFVVHDVLAPIDPKVDNVITNLDNSISGYGEANSFIKIYINDREFSGYIGNNGLFKIDVGDSLRDSDTFSMVSYDYFNNQSNVVKKEVKDIIAPVKPEISFIDNNNNSVNGKGEPNCEVIVSFDDRVYKGSVNENGEFHIFDEEGYLKYSDVVTAKLVDPTGNSSEEVQLKVQKENIGRVILKSMDIENKIIKDAMIKLNAVGNDYSNYGVNEDAVFNLNNEGSLFLEELPFGEYELVIRYRNDDYKMQENILQISINEDNSEIEVLIE